MTHRKVSADPAFGLKISPSVVLRNLLQQYPSGGQFFLEALQNADDTGRGGKFCALLDLRKHSCKSLRSPVAMRSHLQNEAILFYDDAGFEPRDWRSLQFMCDSVKRQSPHETGAFGMGSRSFFHITDVLQVLSGSMLSALDPDDILDTGHFGEQVDFIEDGLLDAFPDEGAPFVGVFGCDMRTTFRGTIIRASLRSSERAPHCTFMPQAFDLSRAKRIFREFEDVLRNGEVIMFLTCISSIELWQWDAGAPHPALISRTGLGTSSGHSLPRQVSSPQQVKAFLRRFSSFAEVQAELLRPDTEPPEVLDVVEITSQHGADGPLCTRTWLRYGRFSRDAEMLRMMASSCCIPAVTLALPLGHSTAGCLFTSLPLPLPTRLPVHVNAFFRLHDNRRAIWRWRQDLDGEHLLWARWNERLLEELVPRTYAAALEMLAGTPALTPDFGHSVWPKEDEVEKEFRPLLDQLVRVLGRMQVLPTPLGELVCPSDALFFLTPTTPLKACRPLLLRLCAKAGWKVVDPPGHVVALLEAREALTIKECKWVLWNAVLPAAPSLTAPDLTALLLAFVEWACSWPEAEVKQLGKELKLTRWIPTNCQELSSVSEAFDPAESPVDLSVVRRRQASISTQITDMGLDAEAVFSILRRCGLKQQISWEDAVEEANMVVLDSDVGRAELLLAHLNTCHMCLSGDRAKALLQLRELPWAPAAEPSAAKGPPAHTAQLVRFQDAFLASATKLVWAVAPSVLMDCAIDELRPARSVEAEPEVLVEQVRAIADTAGGNLHQVKGVVLEHLRTAFAALLPLLSKIQGLASHPRLADVAFVPCLTCEESGDGAALFTPQRAAFKTHSDQRALSPVIGIVIPMDQTIRMLAEAAGVTKEPRIDVLAEALQTCSDADLAVALVVELAARIREQGARPANIMVPTAGGPMELATEVCINDAPWQKQHRIPVLHPRVSTEEGQLLGCTSLREKLAAHCEDAETAVGKLGGEGEGDLPGEVRRLLQDAGDGADLVAEFLRTADAHGAQSVAFLLREEVFDSQRLVDPRSAELQGSALYLCCDEDLTFESTLELERAAGAQGWGKVGLRVMYRHCDCPQLLADGRLHFFDLTRRFVVRPGKGRTRCFVAESLRVSFPDSFVPFTLAPVSGRFKTVFRLALRASRSTLGSPVDLPALRRQMQTAAEDAQKALVFTRHIRRIEYYESSSMVVAHEVSVQTPGDYAASLANLLSSPPATCGDPVCTLVVEKALSTLKGESTRTCCKWVVVHAVGEGGSNSADPPPRLHSGLPAAAAAAQLQPPGDDLGAARLCCGMPTDVRSNSCVWIHGDFAMSSSRSAVPLAQGAADTSQAGRWNSLLVHGPVAVSLRALIVHCTALLLAGDMQREQYFALFPAPGDQLQSALSAAVFAASWVVSEVMLPVQAKSSEAALASLVLAFLQWAACSSKKSELQALGGALVAVPWVPTKAGTLRRVQDSFVPPKSPSPFRTLTDRQADIGSLIEGKGLDSTTVWRVLVQIGMKTEVSWEDVVEEAESIVQDCDVERAQKLLRHLNQHQDTLRGPRASSLQRLEGLAWLPAHEPSASSQALRTFQLLHVRNAFPKSAATLVWAVAPSLSVDSTVKELQPGRSIEKEPAILIEQVRALARAAAGDNHALPRMSASTLQSLQAAFNALLPQLPRLPALDGHPRLVDVAFVPCLPEDEADEGATLFTTSRAAFRASCDHRALRPEIGLVKVVDKATRVIVEAAGVAEEPRAAVLAAALRSGLPTAATMAVLAKELAARLRAGESWPEALLVPTAQGRPEPAGVVFVDDAPWALRQEVLTLHPAVAAEDGKLLGCPSLRNEVARRCESGFVAGDTDSESTELVGHVRRLLQQRSREASVVVDFIRDAEKAGASCVMCWLCEEVFKASEVLDPRAAALHGTALYLCSNKELTPEDVAKMCCVTTSTHEDELSFGAPGLGFTMTFSYSDCPQLLSGPDLYFFDLTRSLVAGPGSNWTRRFSVDMLQAHFADTHAPFCLGQFADRFPTVLRLALRTTCSELGVAVDKHALRAELKKASEVGDKILLFTRHLRRVEFYEAQTLLSVHEALVKDPERYEEFFEGLPASPQDVKDQTFVCHKTITSKSTSPAATACEWAVSHAVSRAAAGKGFLPPFLHAAASTELQAGEKELARGGRVCRTVPLPLSSNSGAWIHGNFSLPPSQASLSLTSERGASRSPGAAWNSALLEGTVPASVQRLIVHCTSLLLAGELSRARYFALFPSPGDHVQTLLSPAVFSVPWILSDVIQPMVSLGVEDGLARLILAFLDWAGSLEGARLKEFSAHLADIRWVPTKGGELCTLCQTFDPLQSPEDLRVVDSKRANLESICKGMDLKLDAVLHVLRSCGMKQEISWEDAVAEAEEAVHSGGVTAAKTLLAHLSKRHASICGTRSAALQKLRILAWVPATRPSVTSMPEDASQLQSLHEIFASSALSLVWAVAPCMCMESAIEELRAGRTVEAEPEILIEQVQTIAKAASAKSGSAPPRISASTLQQLRAAFVALLPLLSKLPPLDQHEHLRSLAFIPCLTADDSGDDADLFTPSCAAFRAQHDHRALSPAIGIVRAGDAALRMIAEAAGVTKEPRADVLAAALCVGAPPELDVAVALAIELASRLRSGVCARPARIMVPTDLGSIERVEQVYIDDAPWQHQREIATLHSRIGAEDGRLLGCASLRSEMARQCEDEGASVEGDAFGQETDLVSQVRQLLQDYGDNLDLVTEFVQNSDDAGATCVAFFLCEETFGVERVVDPRTVPLQGSSLYVCSDKPLSPEDIANMQHVGQSKKRLDFTSSGRFGVGLNVMYRHCDCPQLLANKRLHFFDLTRSFVARPGTSRGRQFTVQKLQEHFPDSHAPFELVQIAGRFPTIFRLALRTKRSELGLAADAATVRAELQRAATMGDKMLLFTRHLRRLEFHDTTGVLATHEAAVSEAARHASFFAALPRSLPEFEATSAHGYLGRTTVVTECPGAAPVKAEWSVAHRLGMAEGLPLELVRAQLERPHGAALLPHGAAAVRLWPAEAELRGGRLCVGVPTPLRTNSCAWIHGGFALLSSRKTLPLPEEGEDASTLDQRWNHMLLTGPIVESIHSLVVHCAEHVLAKTLESNHYFALFPTQGDGLQTLLARSLFNLDWIVSAVIVPAASKLPDTNLTGLILSYLEWAGSWKEAEVQHLSQRMASLCWIPTVGGELRAIKDSFDPGCSPQEFHVVRERGAKLSDIMAERHLSAESVWRVLHSCGMKHDTTWEDVIDEANSIVADQDVGRASLLLQHINRNHTSLSGCRAAALQQLKGLAWIPAKKPNPATETHDTSQLLALAEVFPQSASKLVWAVAPIARVESALEELRPGRSVKGEPQILIEQIRALANTAAGHGAGPPIISATTLQHFHSAFAGLLPLLPELPALAEEPRLHGVAFIPCLAPEGPGAQLFEPRRAALAAQQDHRLLAPVIGIVQPDEVVRKMAEVAGVSQEPRAEILANALAQPASEPSEPPSPELAVALAVELAARLRAGAARPERVHVPTASGTVKPAAEVFVDDAPWHQRKVARLHPRVSAEDGGLLGCASLRCFMASQCEAGGVLEPEGDSFGQEADLVGQIRQLLEEYSDGADVVTEFAQNNDDAGAASVAFILHETSFPSEKLVDARTSSLQGPALYVCSDRPLCADDIARMQSVGHSKKRLDFRSSGRFGVGLNVMYRYCECPQLLANGRLHFFDLTKSFVAQAGGSRGRQFTQERLRENFPDSHAPFEVAQIKRFPTVFRLAFRKERTELGLAMDVAMVRSELQRAAEVADKMLLFTRHLRQLEFRDGKTLMAAHEASVKDAEQYNRYFSKLPSSLPELEQEKPGNLRPFLAQKIITTEKKGPPRAAEWAIAHRVGATGAPMLQVLREQYEKPHGVALLPHGAAAVRVDPPEEEVRGGRICCGMPTSLLSNSCAWVHGGFALLSSRKALPLPEEGEEKPTLDKRWNRMLLEGPVGDSIRGLLLHCTALVLFGGLSLEKYFDIFPLRGDRLQTVLARATFLASMKEAVFPVVRGSKVTWVPGPSPTFFCQELSQEVQDCLVKDGLRLSSLPPDIMLEYEDALGRPRSCLGSQELCTFLRDTFEKLHPCPKDKAGAQPSPTPESAAQGASSLELDLDKTGMTCLATKKFVLELLRFAVRGNWLRYCTEAVKHQKSFSTFTPEELKGVPLLLSHAHQVSTFFSGSVKFSNWRDILPAKKELFIDREAHSTVIDAIDTTIEGVQGAVDTVIPGIRTFSLRELIPYKAEVEASIKKASSFMDRKNEPLRVFWSLVADTFSEDTQAKNYTEFFAAARINLYHSDGTVIKDASAGQPPQPSPSVSVKTVDWSEEILDWAVLPISTGGRGVAGSHDTCVPLSSAKNCVAVTVVNPDPDIVKSLTEILHAASIDTVQHDVMSDDRISRLLCSMVVFTNANLLSLLINSAKIEDLTGVQRHELLAYYSILCVKGGFDLKQVGRLALFKTAAGGFIALDDDITYCCVDPTDPHANALSRLMPPGVMMLAWPTQQVKPIYEHCEVQLCDGEDFMTGFLIPRLPTICAQDENGVASEPFLLQLHAFVVSDGSEHVRQAAAECRFVVSNDLSRMRTPREFTSAAQGAAAAFSDLLSSHTPVWWLQQNDQHLELLHALGMLQAASPAMILLCAGDLDQDAEWMQSHPPERRDSEALRTRSFELVEDFARAVEEAWPRRTAAAASDTTPPIEGGGEVPLPDTTEPLDIEAMCCLLEVSTLRILMAKRHHSELSKTDELEARNSKRQRESKESWIGLTAETELVPLEGTAFGKACQVLWSVCPFADHRSPDGKQEPSHLPKLLELHAKGMFAVFGSFVIPQQAPFDLVLQHLQCLCSVVQREPGVVSVTVGSLMHEELKACWAQLSEHLGAQVTEARAKLETSSAWHALRTLPCVAVASEDVADRPMDLMTLTLPRYSFFQLPLFKGKEANLRLYLRQVSAETSQEAAVFRAFGASDTPHAVDYAKASERVAAKAADLGSAGWEWIVAVLEACVRGVCEELSEVSGTSTTQQELECLHLFTLDGGISKACDLLWADEPRWLKRCEKSGILRLCNLNGQDQREMALALVANAGLRQLSAVIEERRLVDDGTLESPNQMRDKVEQLLQSHEFALGVHAVIVHNAEASKRVVTTPSDIRRELCTIKFKGARGSLSSALFWKDTPGKSNGRKPIPGSEQSQQVYFDEAERAVYVGHVVLGPGEDIFTAELVVALRRALPMLWNVDSFLLEAMLRCALKAGAAGIQPFLEMRAIKVDVLAPRHLGPGDRLPEDLQERLLWTMDATFGEGECAAVLVGEVFTIAEVSRWPDGQQPPGEGISRSYCMKVSAGTLETRKHFEVYKIRSKGAAQSTEPSLELVSREDLPGQDAPTTSADLLKGVGADALSEDAHHIADVKRYLHEMAHMEADDYKAVMRRLFKTWHPDKAGNTELAARIFHILRSHEQWYKKRLNGEITGDDSWLDEEDLGKRGNKDSSTGTAAGTDLLALECGLQEDTANGDEAAEGDDAGGVQASWFEEFEREIRQSKEQKKSDEKPGVRTVTVKMPEKVVEASGGDSAGAGAGAPETDTSQRRVVDKVLSGRYLHEAKLEMVVVRRLMRDCDDGLRSMPSRAVWHCQQAVEMALKSAMLRTCGVGEDEVVGGAAHNLIDFIMRLKTAEANTEEQRRAQEVPLKDEDVEWLKRAYLAARYPKPGRYGVPTLLYNNADAERAQRLAEAFLQWAEKVEDLPDPGRCRRRWSSTPAPVEITEEADGDAEEEPSSTKRPSSGAPADNAAPAAKEARPGSDSGAPAAKEARSRKAPCDDAAPAAKEARTSKVPGDSSAASAARGTKLTEGDNTEPPPREAKLSKLPGGEGGQQKSSSGTKRSHDAEGAGEEDVPRRWSRKKNA